MPSEKHENHSNSTSSCGKFFTSIMCCNCEADRHNDDRDDHDGSDHKKEHKPEARDRETKIKNRKEVVLEKSQTFNSQADQGNTSGINKSDTFADYIRHTKMKIRTMSNIGTGKSILGESDVRVQGTKKDDDSKDNFSNFIDRVKTKIRKTSSIQSREGHPL